MKLRDVLPKEFSAEIAANGAAKKMLDVEVIAKHDAAKGELCEEWPGNHRYIYQWWELANGYAIGWNDNPGLGHSFPAVKMRPKASK